MVHLSGYIYMNVLHCKHLHNY